MQNQWLVSVIIPVYNVRQYLRESLDSVLHQTYHNLEIIIVDDGSTDGSGEICDEYAQRDDRVIVIHQENRGLSAARNAGLDRMAGDLASFLDPDDAYASQYIELMVSAMMKEDVDLVICRYTVHYTAGHLSFPGNGKDISMVRPGLYDRAGAQRALIDNTLNVNAWNKLYRRSLWTGLRFPDGHVYEDIDTTYRIFDRCQSIRCLDQLLYLYRRRAGSITHTVSADNIRDWHLAMEHFESYIAAHTPEIFSPEHLRQHGLDAVVAAAEVDVEDAVPGFSVDVLKLLLPGDARVVDQQRDRPELPLGFLHHGPHGLRVRHVRLDPDSLPALCPQALAEGGGQVCAFDAVDADRPARRGQRLGAGAADAAGGARDQRDLLHASASPCARPSASSIFSLL